MTNIILIFHYVCHSLTKILLLSFNPPLLNFSFECFDRKNITLCQVHCYMFCHISKRPVLCVYHLKNSYRPLQRLNLCFSKCNWIIVNLYQKWFKETSKFISIFFFALKAPKVSTPKSQPVEKKQTEVPPQPKQPTNTEDLLSLSEFFW